MKYKSKLGTVINIPDGLDPKQVAKIKADADAGYGTRAQETAKKLGKKKKQDKPIVTPVDPSSDGNIYDPETKIINDPGEFMKMLPAFDQFKGEVDKAALAAEAYMTRDYDEQEKKEQEAAQQTLAERGIPISGKEGDLWYDTTQGVTKGWQDRRADARNLAYSGALESGLQAYGTNVDAFLTGALGLNDQQLQKYGIDKDYLAKIKALKTQKQIAGMNKGGGGSGGGSQQPTPGFEII